MRIISGSLKGRKFSVPSHFPVRPTTDYAREGLFNVLQNRIDFEDSKILDLFTGTGSIALECWSRGSRDITAVDKHFGCCQFLKKMKNELALDGLNIVKSDALGYVKRQAESFDLIFADPPYNFDGYVEILNHIMTSSCLSADGMLILEYDKHNNFSDSPYFVEEKVYGNVRFAFFQHLA